MLIALATFCGGVSEKTANGWWGNQQRRGNSPHFAYLCLFVSNLKNLLGRVGPESWFQNTLFLESVIRQVFWGLPYTEEDSSPTLFTNYLHIKCLSPPSHLSVWAELQWSSQRTRTQCWELTGYRCIFNLRARAEVRARNKFVCSEMIAVYSATAKMGHSLVLLFSIWISIGGRLDSKVKRSPFPRKSCFRCYRTAARMIWTKRRKRSSSLLERGT